MSFTYVSGTSTSSPYIQISNLGFKPSVVVYWGINSNNAGCVFGMYNINGNAYTSSPAVLYSYRHTNASVSTSAYNIKEKFENNILYLPIQTYEKNNIFYWIAYE